MVDVYSISQLGHDACGIQNGKVGTKGQHLTYAPVAMPSIVCLDMVGDDWRLFSKQVFNLQQQIQHKVAFMRERMLLPGAPPVILLGHSIGKFLKILVYWKIVACKSCSMQ